MSGRGSRFVEAGFSLPKPLIDVNGKPMIQRVVENLNIEGRYIFLVLREHYDRFDLKTILPGICGKNPCEIVIVENITEGAACTCLLAEKFINNNDELIIANSDQLVVGWSPEDFFKTMKKEEPIVDGAILTFKATDPKWSFAKVKENTNIIIEVAEKNPISNRATCLSYHSPVLLANGKTMVLGKIVNSKINVEVMSLNLKTNKLEPKKIINWIKNDGKISEWYELTYENAVKTSNGNSKTLILTGDHKVWTDNGYQRVDEIKDTKIATKYLEPNNLQKEFLDGTLLGDAFYVKPNTVGEQGRLKFKQSKKQSEWFNFKLKVMENFDATIFSEEPSIKKSGSRFINSSGNNVLQFSASPYWNKERARWYDNKKIVPENVQFTPLSLATWYMDDGSLKSDKRNCILCTESFDDNSIKILCDKFKQIGIICTIWKKSKGKAIGIYGHNAVKFFDIINAYIIPSMQYKLPATHQNNFNKKLWDLGEPKLFYSKAIIKKFTPNFKNKYKINYSYCLEVEDNHNFITNDMVVSNCGVYYFGAGKYFVWAAKQMIVKDIRTRNEYYVCPTFNEVIGDGAKIVDYPVEGMKGLGTPEDYDNYMNSLR